MSSEEKRGKWHGRSPWQGGTPEEKKSVSSGQGGEELLGKKRERSKGRSRKRKGSRKTRRTGPSGYEKNSGKEGRMEGRTTVTKVLPRDKGGTHQLRSPHSRTLRMKVKEYAV